MLPLAEQVACVDGEIVFSVYSRWATSGVVAA
jgi:hypothetical protein